MGEPNRAMGALPPDSVRRMYGGFAQKVGIGCVRGADEMRIAQHLSAGFKSRLANKSVKRTTEIKVFSRTIFCFQPSASRTEIRRPTEPSDKSLGYFHVVRFADENYKSKTTERALWRLHAGPYFFSGNNVTSTKFFVFRYVFAAC